MPGDVAQCGQDVEFSAGYTGENGGLRNVAMSIEIFTRSGQCMLMLNSETAGRDFRWISRVGRFACRVRRFRLAPGHYHIGLSCSINGVTADSIQHAAYLTVEAGNFFASGRRPGRGGVLVGRSRAMRGAGAEVSGDADGRGAPAPVSGGGDLTAPPQSPKAGD